MTLGRKDLFLKHLWPPKPPWRVRAGAFRRSSLGLGAWVVFALCFCEGEPPRIQTCLGLSIGAKFATGEWAASAVLQSHTRVAAWTQSGMGWGHLLFAVTVFCGEEGVRRQERQPGESELEDRLDLITGGLIAPTLPHSQLCFVWFCISAHGTQLASNQRGFQMPALLAWSLQAQVSLSPESDRVGWPGQAEQRLWLVGIWWHRL